MSTYAPKFPDECVQTMPQRRFAYVRGQDRIAERCSGVPKFPNLPRIVKTTGRTLRKKKGRSHREIPPAAALNITQRCYRRENDQNTVGSQQGEASVHPTAAPSSSDTAARTARRPHSPHAVKRIRPSPTGVSHANNRELTPKHHCPAAGKR